MNPITAPLLASLSTSRIDRDNDRDANEADRIKRDAERARLRQSRAEAQRDAEAGHRMADAMARVAARGAQLSRPSRAAAIAETPESALAPRPLPAQDRPPASAPGSLPAMSRAEPQEESPLSPYVDGDPPRIGGDPVNGLRQRLASGSSRNLMTDCQPLLASISDELARGGLPGLVPGSEACDSLVAALEFLQGYADTRKARLGEAAQLDPLICAVRTQMLEQGLMPGADTSSGVRVANSLIATGTTRDRPAQPPAERARAGAIRSRRPGNGDDEDESGEPPDAAMQATAAIVTGAGAGSGRDVTGVSAAGLDKDQRKRREETLPLVTLRSV